MKIDKVFDQLLRFSSRVLTLNPPVKETEVARFEKKFGIRLPPDYKEILRKSNGFSLMGNDVYGIHNIKEQMMMSLEKAYAIEHFEVGNPMYLHLVPFSPDGAGNHYCFDSLQLSKESSPIIFWQHDCLYNNKVAPEVVNKDFSDWIKEVLIEWTLENYGYDGNEL